jgi:hypothetical protein
MYTETFITEPSIEELYNSVEEEALYYNDEWLDEDEDILDIVSDEWLDWEPDEEFWAYLSDMEEEEPDFDEVGFDPYAGCYTFDC